MFQMCGVFVEFERGMIRERVNARLARAKAKGVTLGRRQSEKPPSKRTSASSGPEAWAFLKIGRL
jgi:DNA invertase Pin-like site-specific DNA recombinase